jgi:tRNA(Ile)-lysidine synthase
LNARQLTKYHIAVRRRVLRHWLKASGVNPEAIDYQSINRIDGLLARAGRGRAINLAGGITIRRDYQRLEIRGQGTEPGKKYRHKISVPGRTILPETGLIVWAKIGPGVCRARAVFGSFPVSASLSLRKWNKRRILVRPWRPGDRIRPYGLGGSKKIQDIFSDAKVPVALRRRLPVFECGGEIIWIPGYRIAEGWQVGNSAENALQLTVRLMTRRP